MWDMTSEVSQNCHFSPKDGITGLIEPINTRITDPRYFLDSPQHGMTLGPFHTTHLYLKTGIKIINKF